MKRPYCEASAEDTQPKVDADAALSKDIVKQSTMPGLPSISVIVALYNAAPYLDECLDSILAQVQLQCYL
jgi:cellulose synthase/poly-beta-1,6-N-acetylglucosamine synthase-like glycosyltransferase